MIGYAIATPVVSYKGAPVTYFGTYHLLDSGGTKFGQIDEYYCECSGAGSFKADAYSIVTGKNWFAQMYVQ